MLNTVIAYEKEYARRIAKKRELMRNNENYEENHDENDINDYIGKINPGKSIN